MSVDKDTILQEPFEPNTSPYTRLRDAVSDQSEFLDLLYEMRLHHISLCLGYYILRRQLDLNVSQAEAAESIGGNKGWLDNILKGRNGIAPKQIPVIAHNLDANPVEFLIASQFVDKGDISAYLHEADVPELTSIARLLQDIEPKYRPAFVKMINAVADTIKVQQAS